MMLVFVMVVIAVLIVMMFIFVMVVIAVLIVMMLIFFIMVMIVLIIMVVIIVSVHAFEVVQVFVFAMVVVMPRYAVLILVVAHGKSGIAARADPGQSARDILRLPAAVGQRAAPGLARFNFGKPRDIIIISVTRHPVDMKGKITYPEIQPAGAGHAVRNGFILQGHLAFHVVGHIVKYPASHNVDNAAACAAAEQKRRGTAKYLNLLRQHRLRGNRVVSTQTAGIHGAEAIFQHLYSATALPADDRTAYSRTEIAGGNAQFIGNRFTDAADTAGPQFFFRQDLHRPNDMLIDLRQRMGSDPDLFHGLSAGRRIIVAGTLVGKRGRAANTHDHEQQDDGSQHLDTST